MVAHGGWRWAAIKVSEGGAGAGGWQRPPLAASKASAWLITVLLKTLIFISNPCGIASLAYLFAGLAVLFFFFDWTYLISLLLTELRDSRGPLGKRVMVIIYPPARCTERPRPVRGSAEGPLGKQLASRAAFSSGEGLSLWRPAVCLRHRLSLPSVCSRASRGPGWVPDRGAGGREESSRKHRTPEYPCTPRAGVPQHPPRVRAAPGSMHTGGRPPQVPGSRGGTRRSGPPSSTPQSGKHAAASAIDSPSPPATLRRLCERTGDGASVFMT